MRRSPKGDVSVSKETGARIREAAIELGITSSQLVERLLLPILDGTEPMPESLRVVEPAAQVPAEKVQAPESTSPSIGVPKAVAVAPRDAGLSKSVAIKISPLLAEDLEAAKERAAAKGVAISESELADRAINRMLDVMESLPKSSFCAVCAEGITGSAKQRPLGKDGALVWVCWTCDTEHPRSGRYSFNGGRSSDHRDTTNARSNGHVGDGNKRTNFK